ncbi:DUF1697 domain-containing protein [Solirubrobacter sp. CPCC 204708]|uniref:DUF1697 domain-containing protein n=1 Tax=Solirubrobacter deserti TaxID=2282478 RepID=A0ABT4RGD5_9ACTN|nr:DUF1697 domain-containing protein [Solirubrobacter deserti]MBE2319654.1 DUF1697 domain-containing protein [Solirubrobacter deserti]MDA0137607.1 DUF1697 domain-containing protein [Solirubrobacter deserti]
MPRNIALLRGINLGAKRRVAMADLRALLEALGYTDVRTVLASGNAIFTGRVSRAQLEAALEERFKMKIDVVLRTMDELRAVVEADPFGEAVTNPTRYFVVFGDREPDLAYLEGQDFAPDAYAVRGREIYAWCPEGMQNSRLMKAFSKAPATGTATVRNWATVGKLLE